jgi:hypothetical protein
MKRLMLLAALAAGTIGCSSSGSQGACESWCSKLASCKGISNAGCGQACAQAVGDAGYGCSAVYTCLANQSCPDLISGTAYETCAGTSCDGG